MNDSRTAMAAAVASGYLLGRTKKAKLAFAVGSYLVGRRAGLSPGQVLSQGLGGLQRTPQFPVVRRVRLALFLPAEGPRPPHSPPLGGPRP
ncbi:hypothetical protein AB0B09_34450, partial [Streptomyces sp. NPDC044948]